MIKINLNNERVATLKEEKILLEVEFLSKGIVEAHIEGCEGKHVQQVIYSTYHKTLTQVCFGCKKIRTSLSREEI